VSNLGPFYLVELAVDYSLTVRVSNTSSQAGSKEAFQACVRETNVAVKEVFLSKHLLTETQ